MVKSVNYLIGNGHLLASDIPPTPKGFRDKVEVYTFEEAKKRLEPQISATAAIICSLPDEACPDDYGVMNLVLHPSYIAKSYYPIDFLRATQLTPIGSKTAYIKPTRNRVRKYAGQFLDTTQLIVAGKRHDLSNLDEIINGFSLESTAATQFARIEDVSSYHPSMYVRSVEDRCEYYDVTLHLLPRSDSSFVLSSFIEYCTKFDFEVLHDFSFGAGTLCYLPIYGPRSRLEEIGKFTFVRAVRDIAPLRSIHSGIDLHGVSSGLIPPASKPLSSLPKVAILDGGIPDNPGLDTWINRYVKMDEEAADHTGAIAHGLGVASAFLFGPVKPGSIANRPFSYATAIRIVDNFSSRENPLEMYRTLGFIEQVLLSRQYGFINLSLGPAFPMEDEDIHPWTAVIDNLLQDGNTLMTIAVGNNGEKDEVSGNARIQVPSDCVNALSVGSATCMGENWTKASYSAIGPGRRPGVVKPDVLMFGGSPVEYFHALIPARNFKIQPYQGTSYAAPYLLRSAVGISAVLGNQISPLAIKALLIHSAKTQSGSHPSRNGWGKVPDDLLEIITCDEGTARIIYQGQLCPGKYIRAKIPVPEAGINGKCDIYATFCFTCPVDPQDSCSYTRAGLEIVFRKDCTNIKGNAKNAQSDTFFTKKPYETERDFRNSGGKWENVLHAHRSMLGYTLKDPVFDIHYMARAGGAATSSAENIPYALVITIKAPRNPTLFADILNDYPMLCHIEPQVSLPLQI